MSSGIGRWFGGWTSAWSILGRESAPVEVVGKQNAPLSELVLGNIEVGNGTPDARLVLLQEGSVLDGADHLITTQYVEFRIPGLPRAHRNADKSV